MTHAAQCVGQHSPPGQVQAAISLVAGGCLVAVARAVLMKDWTRATPAAVGVGLLAAICLLWLYGLWQRLNWLRWATVILGGAGSIVGLWGVYSLGDPVQVKLYWLQFILIEAAVVLLLLRAASTWYTRGRRAD